MIKANNKIYSEWDSSGWIDSFSTTEKIVAKHTIVIKRKHAKPPTPNRSFSINDSWKMIYSLLSSM